MISILIFRIHAKNRTIWYNLIQTSVPLVYTNYFYNIYCPNMGGSRGGDLARLFVFATLKFSVRPLLGIWTPPGKIFWIRACQTRSFRIFFFFFKIITSLANIFSFSFSPREILGFFLFQYRFSFYLHVCDNFLNVTE